MGNELSPPTPPITPANRPRPPMTPFKGLLATAVYAMTCSVVGAMLVFVFGFASLAIHFDLDFAIRMSSHAIRLPVGMAPREQVFAPVATLLVGAVLMFGVGLTFRGGWSSVIALAALCGATTAMAAVTAAVGLERAGGGLDVAAIMAAPVPVCLLMTRIWERAGRRRADPDGRNSS